MRALVLACCLVSCEGRCSQSAAAHDTVGPLSICESDSDGSTALCVSGPRAYVCYLDGVMFHVATCVVVLDATGAK